MQYSISNLNVFMILVAIGFSFVRRFAYIMFVIFMARVIDILCKSTSLPKAEMAEGPQHASKVDTGDRPNLPYNYPQDRISHGVVCCPSWAWIHSDSGPNTIVSKFEESEKSSAKSILGKQFQTMVIGLTPKRNVTNVIQRNTGSPKGRNPYWRRSPNNSLNIWDLISLGFHVEVGQRCYSTATGTGLNDGANSKLNLTKLDNDKFTGLYKSLANQKTLTLAYNNIKSNPGNMTVGLDSETLDGVSNLFLESLSRQLESEEFQFKPARRVHIPKSNGSTRPLAIASPRDKIVQEAMRLILEVIFEPSFSNLSHGFRPDRSCHTALKRIATWTGITWAIVGDIKGFFDNVDHHILARLLQKRIQDQRFMNLYWKLVKAGYVERSISIKPTIGVPQGSLISPLLSNIYLHELDRFMEDLIDRLSSKKTGISRPNPEWKKITYKIGKLTKIYNIEGNKTILKEIRILETVRRTINSRIREENRVYYIRYADDWIVGVVGKYDFTQNLKELIAKFLEEELKLSLSQEKTKITHLGKDRANFLGFRIWVRRSAQALVRVRYDSKANKRISARINQARVWMAAPMDDIMNELEKQGFIKRYEQDPYRKIPNAITKFIFLDHKAIIERYNAIIRGYLNYYSPADNYFKFGSVIGHILRHSCAKTLARKFNLRTRAGAFKEFGKNLKVTITKLRRKKH